MVDQVVGNYFSAYVLQRTNQVDAAGCGRP
jgi:hypothetical protein